MRDKRHFYIAIETKSRELAAKVLLACVAAERGFEVYIGQKDYLDKIVRYLPRGIYLDKSAAITKLKKFRRLKADGHAIVVNDEEGLVVISPESYLDRRVFSDTLKITDIFFTWGDEQAHAVNEIAKGYDVSVISTGNPRFDLLRQEYRSIYQVSSSQIASRFSPFILINSKFGTCNHIDGAEAYIKRQVASGLIKNQSDEQFRRGYVAHSHKLFKEFCEAVSVLSKRFAEYNIVIRPHPIENHEPWKKIAAGLPNVHVIGSDSSIPWIMAADVVIHNGCTTGIEAHILKKPVIAFKPIVDDQYEISLPNMLSWETYSTDELIEAINTILSSDEGQFGSQRCYEHEIIASRHISGLDGPLASERMFEAIDGLSVIQRPRFINMALKCLGAIDMKARGLIRSCIRMKCARSDANRSRSAKFPGLSCKEVEEVIASLNRASGRFGSLKITKAHRNCYRVVKRGYDE